MNSELKACPKEVCAWQQCQYLLTNASGSDLYLMCSQCRSIQSDNYNLKVSRRLSSLRSHRFDLIIYDYSSGSISLLVSRILEVGDWETKLQLLEQVWKQGWFPPFVAKAVIPKVPKADWASYLVALPSRAANYYADLIQQFGPYLIEPSS